MKKGDRFTSAAGEITVLRVGRSRDWADIRVEQESLISPVVWTKRQPLVNGQFTFQARKVSMSRIILSKWDNGDQRVVVGWDHPAGGAYWQEFNKEPDPDPETGERDWPEDWEEMIRFGGYVEGISLDAFRNSVPEDMRPMITDEVMALLAEHAKDPDSGYRRQAIDLSGGLDD